MLISPELPFFPFMGYLGMALVSWMFVKYLCFSNQIRLLEKLLLVDLYYLQCITSAITSAIKAAGGSATKGVPGWSSELCDVGHCCQGVGGRMSGLQAGTEVLPLLR